MTATDEPLYKVHLTPTVVNANYTSTAMEFGPNTIGSLTLIWTGYNGTTGAANIEVSNNGTNWSSWGGAQGAVYNIAVASDHQSWLFTEMGHRYVRVKFYIGNGSTATLSINYVEKNA